MAAAMSNSYFNNTQDDPSLPISPSNGSEVSPTVASATGLSFATANLYYHYPIILKIISTIIIISTHAIR